MEYFYTSELTCAAAAEAHNFEDGESCEIRKHSKHWWSEVLLDCCSQWRFPRTPHNEALMEVRVGDLAKDEKHAGYVTMFDYCLDDEMEAINVIACVLMYNGTYPLNNGKVAIIQRNIDGKPYPFPVWDSPIDKTIFDDEE